MFCYNVFTRVSDILEANLRLLSFKSIFSFFEFKVLTDLLPNDDLVLYSVEKAVVKS